jgi:hypothetical protein
MMTRSGLITLAGLACLALALLSSRAHADDHNLRIKVSLTCQDVQAVVQLVGWPELVRRAREAGASEGLIDEARRCLPSSNR